jgi:DNA-binding CsgD family transcriptional regulator
MTKNPEPAGAYPQTFTQWRENWQCLQHIPQLEALGPAIFQNNPALELVLCIGHCAVLVADWQTMRYVYVSESAGEVLGRAPHEFYAGGVGFMQQIVVPAEQPLFARARQLHQQFFAQLSPADKLQMRSAMDYHVRKRDGQQARILHQSTVLALDHQPSPQPVYVLVICNDITQWKPDGQMVATVHAGTKNYTCHLPQEDQLQAVEVLSRREKEILRGLARGQRSVDVAEALFISPNTVEWHRKNILKKLGAKSSSEAVRLGLTLGLI